MHAARIAPKAAGPARPPASGFPVRTVITAAESAADKMICAQPPSRPGPSTAAPIQQLVRRD
jgi:hypothetical protein